MGEIYAKMTDRQVEYIQSRLRYESYYKTWGYSWMRKYGYIKPMPAGIKELIEPVLLKTEPANMGKDVEEFRDLKIQMKKKEYKVILHLDL